MRRLTYILAASHSGSTLLAMLLGAHPEIRTFGELKFSNLGDPERYLCSCGMPISRCSFWIEVKNRMKIKGIDFDIRNAHISIHHDTSQYIRRLLGPLHRGPYLEFIRDFLLSFSPKWHPHLKTVQYRSNMLLDTLYDITKANTIVDSSKVGIRLKYLLRNNELDIRIIRLIRDGRGVSLAYMDPHTFADTKNEDLRAGGFGGNLELGRDSYMEAIREWRRSNEEADIILSQLPKKQYITVHYEELCTNTDNILKEVFNFLDVDSTVLIRDFRLKFNHVIGNGMRFDQSSEIRCDEQWKTVLSIKNLEIFAKEAGAQNRKYGYQ
jgi:hypothetical protein